MKFSLCRLVMCGGYSRLSSPVPCCPECTDQGHYVKGDKVVSGFILLVLGLVLVLSHFLPSVGQIEISTRGHLGLPTGIAWEALFHSTQLHCSALNCTALHLTGLNCTLNCS